MFDPLNPDLTREGRKDGQKLREENEPKDSRGMMKQWKTWVHGKDAQNSYCEGLNQGYNVVNANTISNSNLLFNTSRTVSSLLSAQGNEIYAHVDMAGLKKFLEELKLFVSEIENAHDDLNSFAHNMVKNESWDDPGYIEFMNLFRNNIDHQTKEIINKTNDEVIKRLIQIIG